MMEIIASYILPKISTNCIKLRTFACCALAAARLPDVNSINDWNKKHISLPKPKSVCKVNIRGKNGYKFDLRLIILRWLRIFHGIYWESKDNKLIEIIRSGSRRRARRSVITWLKNARRKHCSINSIRDDREVTASEIGKTSPTVFTIIQMYISIYCSNFKKRNQFKLRNKIYAAASISHDNKAIYKEMPFESIVKYCRKNSILNIRDLPSKLAAYVRDNEWQGLLGAAVPFTNKFIDKHGVIHNSIYELIYANMLYDAGFEHTKSIMFNYYYPQDNKYNKNKKLKCDVYFIEVKIYHEIYQSRNNDNCSDDKSIYLVNRTRKEKLIDELELNDNYTYLETTSSDNKPIPYKLFITDAVKQLRDRPEFGSFNFPEITDNKVNEWKRTKLDVDYEIHESINQLNVLSQNLGIQGGSWEEFIVDVTSGQSVKTAAVRQNWGTKLTGLSRLKKNTETRSSNGWQVKGNWSKDSIRTIDLDVDRPLIAAQSLLPALQFMSDRLSLLRKCVPGCPEWVLELRRTNVTFGKSGVYGIALRVNQSDNRMYWIVQGSGILVEKIGQTLCVTVGNPDNHLRSAIKILHKLLSYTENTLVLDKPYEDSFPLRIKGKESHIIMHPSDELIIEIAKNMCKRCGLSVDSDE